MYLKELWRFIRPVEYSRAVEGRTDRARPRVVNSSVALGFANLTVKRNPREEAVDRAGRARGRREDIPLVSKERFDDFEGRGVSNRRDRPAGRNGRGLTRRDRGRGPLASAT